MLALCRDICHSKVETPEVLVHTSSAIPQQHRGSSKVESTCNAVGSDATPATGSRLRQPRSSLGVVSPEEASAIAAGAAGRREEPGAGLLGSLGVNTSPDDFVNGISFSRQTSKSSNSSKGSSKTRPRKVAPDEAKESKDRSANTAGAPGLFGVMRQPSLNTVIQAQLKKEVITRAEDLERATEQDEQRLHLIVALEREVFKKEQQLREVQTSIQHLGEEADMELGALALEASVELPAAGSREKLIEELRAREVEAEELGEHLRSLEEKIHAKRTEVVAKGDATLKLLFELSRNAEQQRLKGANVASPCLKAAAAVPIDNDAQQPL